MSFALNYLREAKEVIDSINPTLIERMVEILAHTRNSGGRLFIVGSGGGAGHASHASCDFRKLCGIETYCPTDNVSELTARINDDGWATCLSNYLQVSKLSSGDCVLVLSVGGGNLEKNISPNLVNCVKLAKEVGAKVVGIVGRDGGYTAKVADACVTVPTVNAEHVTPHTEAFQAVIWHLIVSHPALKVNATKWESTK